MAAFAAYTIIGLSLGGIFSLAALGIVLIYRTTGVLNFAHGAMGMFSTFIAWQVFYGWSHPFWPGWLSTLLAVIAGLVFAAAMGLFLEFAVFRWVRTREPVVKAVITIGVLLALQSAASLIWKNNQYPLLIIDALAAALIGGLVSLPLTVLGGFILGLLETYPTIWIQSLGFPRLVALLVILAVLVVRNPRGFAVAAK